MDSSDPWPNDLSEDILDVLPGGLVRVDGTGNIRVANRIAQDFLGLALDRLTGLHVVEFAGHTFFESGESCPPEAYPVSQCLATGQNSGPTTIGVQQRGGDLRWGSFSAFPVRDPRGGRMGAVISFIDVTSFVEGQKRLRESELRLRAQKLESLGVLAGGVAHDFNNLLVGVMGYADLALRYAPEGSALGEYLQMVLKSAQRGAELTHQMLAYAGRARTEMAPMALDVLVKETEEALRVVAGPLSSLRLHLEGNLPPVEADPVQLRQVLLNLVANAAEASTQDDADIEVATAHVNVRGVDIADFYLGETLAPGPYIKLSVRDKGGGMSPQTRSRLFEPFFTTKFTGRGLGLSVVFGIVRSHHGGIRVKSDLGHGTSVDVFLAPTLPGQNVQLSPPVPGSRTFSSGQGPILLADDDSMARDVALRVLSGLGFEVIAAADGREALERFRETGSRLRAMVLDDRMPHLSGREVLVEARRSRPELPAIVVSGAGRGDGILENDPLTIELQKPYSPTALSAALRQLLGG